IAHGEASGRRQGRSRAAETYHRSTGSWRPELGTYVSWQAPRGLVPAVPLRRGTANFPGALITLRGVIRLLRPVGPLAPHVYWLRRIMVLAVAALVVFAATKVVGAILPDDEPRTSNTAASGEGPAEKPRPARTLTPRGDAGPGG